MRTLSRLFILGVILVFCGCNLETDVIQDSIEPFIAAEPLCPEVSCPEQDIVEWVYIPSLGIIPVQTKKGSYDELYHSINLFKLGMGWITVEEYDSLVAEETKQTGGSI